MTEPDAPDGHAKRWLVLLVQDGSECTTEDPRQETFMSEREALAFAKESSRNDKEGGEGAVYHVMRTTHTVYAKRRVTVTVVAARK